MRLRLLMMFLCCMGLVVSAQAQGVRAIVVNEFANIRIAPAIGAEVIGTVSAGYEFSNINARNTDNQWIRVDFQGEEGWVNLTPLTVLDGDINALPIADPRFIVYGGDGSPRAGTTNQTGAVSAKANNGVRVRSGPSKAYPTLANINYNQLLSITGHTASNIWYQVSFEGTLGWVNSTFIILLSGDINALPVGGIVASAKPDLGDDSDTYIGVLKLMRDRLNIARESLVSIRTSWADAALTGRASCQPYPPRPSDFNIALPVLQVYYQTLNPLQTDFNTAMFNLRKSIDLFIDVCNQPGTGNPVGTATVQGALDTVNLTEQQIDNLIARLAPLIPDDSIGSNECLLTYRGRAEVLPVLNLNTIYLDKFTARSYAAGYCFDGVQGQSVILQILPLPGSNLAPVISISPLDDPKNFAGINRGAGGANTLIQLGPIVLPRTTRYVLIIADLGLEGRTGGPKGDIALRLFDASATITVGTQLSYDPATGSVNITVGATTGVSNQTTTTTTPVLPPCPSTQFTCQQLVSCSQAQACLNAGNFTLDGDSDGIPCEETWCQ